MAYIRINRTQLLKTANVIEDYVKRCKEEMAKADSIENNELPGAWRGKDTAEFDLRWRKLNDSDSSYAQMIQVLENYVRYLRDAEEEYRVVQDKAINRAAGLRH